ncbi:mechanosensitive ion channel [bacterium]|nr:mechanosensitive ion channel [bacterium]
MGSDALASPMNTTHFGVELLWAEGLLLRFTSPKSRLMNTHRVLLLTAGLLGTVSAAFGQTGAALPQDRLDSLRLHAPHAAVLGPLGDTLFLIYRGSGDLSLEERAASFTERIAELSRYRGLTEDSLPIRQGDAGTELWFRNQLIINVNENDERLYQASGTTLASVFRERTLKAARQYQARTHPKTIALEIGASLLVLGILIGSIWLVQRTAGWWERRYLARIERKREQREQQGLDVLFSDNTMPWVKTLFRASRWLLSLALIAMAIPILFAIFPETRPITQEFLSAIAGPLLEMGQQFKDYLPNLVTIGILVLFFRLLIRVFQLIKTELELGKMRIRGFYPEWAAPTFQLIRVLMLALLFVSIFPYLPGSQSPVFQGVSVFLGFLFTFSSAGSLSNIISGMMLTYMRLFRIGDRVRMGDVYGDVIERNLLVTRIKTPFNEVISVPNSAVMNTNSINYSTLAKDEGLILSTVVTIGYDVPYPLLYATLTDAARSVEGVQHHPEPFVLQTSLDDFYVSYRLCFFTSEANRQAGLLSAVHEKIQEFCALRDIEIMSPHYRAQRDGNTTTVPNTADLK